MDDERLALYAAWHAGRERDRAWDPAPMDAEAYAVQFAFPHPAAWELSLRDGDRLVALTLCDITPRAWSAIFGFYDPGVARLSPGVATVLLAVEMARERGDPARLPRLPRDGMPVDALQGGVPARTSCCRDFPGPDEVPRWVEAAAARLNGWHDERSGARWAGARARSRADVPA